MGIFSFLSPSKRSSPSEIFQKELADLQLRIERHETRLQSIRARERGTTALVTIYSFVFWFVYGCLWYFGWGFNRWINYFRRTTQPGSGSDRIMTNTGSTLSEILEACPIIIIPVALTFVRRFFKSWYQYKQESEQVQLTKLKKTLVHTVDELKKQTSYNMTRELIERYDDKAQANPPNRAPLNHIQPTSAMSTPNSQTLRQRIPPGSSPSTMVSAPTNQSNYASPAVQPPRSAHQFGPGNSSSSSAPSPLSARGWADRVANVLLGDDEARPESKYALICKKCFSHNGLVLKEELDHIQYRCPHCGNFNPAKNLNRENETSSLPTNSTSEGEDENDKMTSLIQQKNKKYQRQSLGLPQSTGPLQSTVESNRRAISLNSSESSRSLNKDLVDQSKSLEEDSMSSGSTEQ